jgi:hypothetical protein
VYQQKTVVYGGYTGAYACTQCTCAGSATCQPQVGLYYYPCTGTPSAYLMFDGTSCSTGDPTLTQHAKVLDVGTPTPATCSPTGGGVLMGNAVGTSPVTVCCSS